ncbi:helix-turn-helix transcriptional regulator [Sphingomonas sp.]|uniref:helix-turn-helix transcriptional regulator n=1 Tax=Sphingomonas sp. TaxID=28214 RepID=UPI0025EC8BBC|nr:helix-turn-helix transcriptional regulator [Sphingomonas sp.]
MAGEARRLLAVNLRALRKARGMTQEDVAGVAEIDRSYVSEIENQRFSASLDMVERLAGAFGLPVHRMLDPDTARDASPRR